MLADAHLHLAHLDSGDRVAVLDGARKAGVGLFITAGTDAGSSRTEVEWSSRYGTDVFVVVGQHPWWADRSSDRSLADLRGLLDDPRVVGVGEVGLDHVRCAHPHGMQMEVFRAMLGLAEERSLPVVIHGDQVDVRTHEELLVELSRRRAVRGMVHGFDSTREVAERWLDLGFILSVSAVVTWPEKEALREVVRSVPLDSIAAESDAPAPYGLAGREQGSNHPRNVAGVVGEIARIRGSAMDEVAQATVRSVRRLFPRIGALEDLTAPARSRG